MMSHGIAFFTALFFALLASSFHKWMRQWRNVNKKKLVDKNCMGVDRTEQNLYGRRNVTASELTEAMETHRVDRGEVDRTEDWLYMYSCFTLFLHTHSLLLRLPLRIFDDRLVPLFLLFIFIFFQVSSLAEIISTSSSASVHCRSSHLLSSQTELFRGDRFQSSPANRHFSNHVSYCLWSPFLSDSCFLFHQAPTSSQSFFSSGPPLLFINTVHASHVVKPSHETTLFWLPPFLSSKPSPKVSCFTSHSISSLFSWSDLCPSFNWSGFALFVFFLRLFTFSFHPLSVVSLAFFVFLSTFAFLSSLSFYPGIIRGCPLHIPHIFPTFISRYIFIFFARSWRRFICFLSFHSFDSFTSFIAFSFLLQFNGLILCRPNMVKNLFFLSPRDATPSQL